MKVKIGDYFLWESIGWYTIGRITSIGYDKKRKFYRYKDIVNKLSGVNHHMGMSKFYEDSGFHKELTLLTKSEVIMELL